MNRFSRLKWRPIAFIIFALGLFPTETRADFTNYQRYVLGERSLGMGGAYTAAVDDSMALYYNPGGLVFADTTAVSGSKSIYAVDRKIIEDGFVHNFGEQQDAYDLDTTNDLKLPSTLTLMANFGRRTEKHRFKRHAFGLAILVPYQDEFSFRSKYKDAGSIVNTQTDFFSESHVVVWYGAGYSFRPTRKLGLGLTVFFSDNKYQRRYDGNFFDPPSDLSNCGMGSCGELEFIESTVTLETRSIIIGAGLLHKYNKNWHFGLSARAPSIYLGAISKGSLDQTYGYSSTTDPSNTYSYMFTDDYNLKVQGFEPASIRAGVAYINPEFLTVDLDVSFHFPTKYSRIIGDPVADRLENDPSASPVWFDPGIVRSIERLPVLNANLGSEFLLKHGITIRTGVFTDFSSAPEVTPSDTPQLSRVHHFGGTFSFGHKGEKHDITVGVIGTYGRGKASTYQPELSAEPGGATFLPSQFTEGTIIVFIAGLERAIMKSAKELLEKGTK